MENQLVSRRSVLVGSALAASGLVACRRTKDAPSSTTTAPAASTTAPSTVDVSTTKPSETAATTPVTTTAPTTPAATTVDATTVVASDDYFPPPSGPWATSTPSDAGFTDDGIQAVLDLVGASNSQSFVLLRNGHIVAEQYWMGADETFVRDIASVQKPVMSTLVGLARDRGLLQLDDTVSSFLGAGWSQAPAAAEEAITLRHLMTMTSGLNPRTLRVDTAPDVAWNYNTDAYQKLRRVLEVAAGSDINAISTDWLFAQIGIPDQAWQIRPGAPDATGDELWGLRITAREIARFGLFAAHNGAWMGSQITDPGWFAEAWTATPVKADYGLIWWLLGKGRLASRGAPPDLVAGLGAQDQKLYVSPSTGIVVARQGDAAGESTEAGSDFDGLLIAAIARSLR